MFNQWGLGSILNQNTVDDVWLESDGMIGLIWGNIWCPFLHSKLLCKNLKFAVTKNVNCTRLTVNKNIY